MLHNVNESEGVNETISWVYPSTETEINIKRLATRLAETGGGSGYVLHPLD